MEEKQSMKVTPTIYVAEIKQTGNLLDRYHLFNELHLVGNELVTKTWHLSGSDHLFPKCELRFGQWFILPQHFTVHINSTHIKLVWRGWQTTHIANNRHNMNLLRKWEKNNQ